MERVGGEPTGSGEGFAGEKDRRGGVATGPFHNVEWASLSSEGQEQ